MVVYLIADWICGCLQHCPPGRFLLFATVGLALYVMGPAPLRRAWQRLLAMLPPMHVRTLL